MEMWMNLDGKLIDTVKISAANYKDETYMKWLKDGLRLKHHGLIVKLQKEPVFYLNVPTGT